MRIVEQLKKLFSADFVALHDEGDGWCDCTDRPEEGCPLREDGTCPLLDGKQWIELPNGITLYYE